MAIVWIARLLGIPIRERLAGADIFLELKSGHNRAKPLRVFFFGGADAVGQAACRSLNSQPTGLCCVGSLNPGFGSVEEMSRDDIIDKVNASNANFLVVALGARKGQAWLQRNHQRLRIPLRGHLGAVINFEAAWLRRAPAIMQYTGLEWLWRIYEEPHLWRRYCKDGTMLFRLLFTRIFPLAFWTFWSRIKYKWGQDLTITRVADLRSVVLHLAGTATCQHVHKVISRLAKRRVD